MPSRIPANVIKFNPILGNDLESKHSLLFKNASVLIYFYGSLTVVSDPQTYHFGQPSGHIGLCYLLDFASEKFLSSERQLRSRDLILASPKCVGSDEMWFANDTK